MTTATTKDTLADVIREAWHEMGYYGRADLAPGWLDGFASVTADAVLAADVVIATTDEAALARHITARWPAVKEAVKGGSPLSLARVLLGAR